MLLLTWYCLFSLVPVAVDRKEFRVINFRVQSSGTASALTTVQRSEETIGETQPGEEIQADADVEMEAEEEHKQPTNYIDNAANQVMRSTNTKPQKGDNRLKGENIKSHKREDKTPDKEYCPLELGEDEKLSKEEQKEQEGITGRKIADLKEMWEGSEGGEKVLVVSANVRSSQERRKIYMLAREMDDASKTTEHMAVIMAVQETWLKSQKARTEISQERGNGWMANS